MAKSLEDIFDDDDFGLLESKERQSFVRTDEDRLIDSFEEINLFYEKNHREPSTSSMSEYSLFSRLKGFRSNDQKINVLKAFDRFNLLGEVEIKIESIDDILDDDDLGLLENDGDDSIFDFKLTPLNSSRANADYIAQRKSISQRDFKKYEAMFHQVHQDLREGKRKLLEFNNAEDNLIEGNYYLVDGLLAYLEVSNAEKVLRENKSGDRMRIEGRTVTIFENGTVSNMLFRSLGKAIQKNGKLVTNTDEGVQNQLVQNAMLLHETDNHSGWIYVLRSKSNNRDLLNIPNLFKIGFSKLPVEDRIKNAPNEATYLFDNVEVAAKYNCYNLNVHALENLLHRFFAEVCIDIDLYDKEGKRYFPREWFSVPFEIIDNSIDLVLNNTIFNYKYDKKNNKIILK